MAPDLPLELAAFADSLDPAILEAAARRAEALGVGGDEVLRCHTGILPETIARTLAAHLGIEYDNLDSEPGRLPVRLLGAASAGVLARPAPDGTMHLTVAPRGLGIRRLAAALADDPALRGRLRFAAPEKLAAHARAAGADEFARQAVLGLHRRWPELSAVFHGRHRVRWFLVPFAAAVLFGASLAPDALLFVTQILLAFSFLAWTGLRIRACLRRPTPQSSAEVAGRRPPLYTIIVPLYREAAIVPRLIAGLRRLRYPRERLDIKLVLEPDDRETRRAVDALRLPAPFEVILAPPRGPRTKPKALAAALPFARGAFTVVYDAEDEPDPDQLRGALAAFAADPDLACVQAPLAIDNLHDGWLTRQFAAEYAGQFDVFLPALAAMRLPLPLGGSSNHFRTDVLRRVGGWDPYNVTEDADLGMRLARFGYRCAVIDSTTWEEGPVRLDQWIGQRTRWFKGWMQTWIVHMRSPTRLLRELGGRGFAALQLLVGGTVLAALVHPFFLAFVIHDIAAGTFVRSGTSLGEAFRAGLALVTLVAGYVGAIALGLVGLRRRRLLDSAWVLATIPVYWLLLSAAAWRAVWQLLTAPHHWDKTEHGLARTSVRAGSRAPARRAFRPPRPSPIPVWLFPRPSPLRGSAADPPPPRPPRAAD